MLAYFQTLKSVAHQLSFNLISFFSVCWWSALMNIHTISVELGDSALWKNRWGCCSRMSECFCPRGTAVDSQSPCWAQDNHSDYQSKRFLVPGEFLKWDFMEDSVREPSRLFVRVHTHPSSSSPWHLQPEFPTQNHIQIYNAEEPIRSEASLPAPPVGKSSTVNISAEVWAAQSL